MCANKCIHFDYMLKSIAMCINSTANSITLINSLITHLHNQEVAVLEANYSLIPVDCTNFDPHFYQLRISIFNATLTQQMQNERGKLNKRSSRENREHLYFRESKLFYKFCTCVFFKAPSIIFFF